MAAIGVLALQGGYAAHSKHLERLGHCPVEVRTCADLHGLAGLCFPGGESTVQLKLVRRWNLEEPLTEFANSGKPVLATCAGLILAARSVTNPVQESLGWMDVEVQRNGWGRQLDSFEAQSDGDAQPLVFIRAPRILHTGPEVSVVTTYKGEAVAVKQGNITGATFHPELTESIDFHAKIFGTA